LATLADDEPLIAAAREPILVVHWVDVAYWYMGEDAPTRATATRGKGASATGANARYHAHVDDMPRLHAHTFRRRAACHLGR